MAHEYAAPERSSGGGKGKDSGKDSGKGDLAKVRLGAAKDLLDATTAEEVDAALMDWCRAYMKEE
jgi:hypothetical protein